jgi:hypothetical protein
MSTIELTSGSATLTARADYLLVVEHGTLASSDEVLRYVTELETASARYKLRRLLVDARSETDATESRGDARSAMWRWIRAQRSFEMIGFVLRDDMTIARVNMTALSERLPVRAFLAVADGHRWLAKLRSSSTAIPQARPGPSSVPPPPMTPRTPLPTKTPTPAPQAAGDARDSATRLARLTQRIPAVSSQEADAALQNERRTPSGGERARDTLKIAAVDPATADAILKRSKP